MTNKNSTVNQDRSLLLYIWEYKQELECAPSIRDVGTEFAITSTAAATYKLKRLVRLGYMTRTPKIHRSIILTTEGYELIGKKEHVSYDEHIVISYI